MDARGEIRSGVRLFFDFDEQVRAATADGGIGCFDPRLAGGQFGDLARDVGHRSAENPGDKGKLFFVGIKEKGVEGDFAVASHGNDGVVVEDQSHFAVGAGLYDITLHKYAPR